MNGKVLRSVFLGGALLILIYLVSTSKQRGECVEVASSEMVPPSSYQAEVPVEDAVVEPVVEVSEAPSVASPRWTAERLVGILQQADVVPYEALLVFDSPERIASFRSRAAGAGMKVLWSDGRVLSARVAFTDLNDFADLLNAHGEGSIEVGPNYIARIPRLPQESAPVTDIENAGGREPFETSLMAAIEADRPRDGWGQNVTVAVLDSGVAAHPTFEGVGLESISVVDDAAVSVGHGTAMASLVAGRQYPAEGVAPFADLLDVQVIGENGVSNTGLLAEGILAATDQRAEVINISLGATGDSPALRNAVEYASSRQTVIVAAAGNEQQNRISYPAAYPDVIAVGAVDANLEQAYFSNSGEQLTLAAPGVGVVSAYMDEKFVIGSGTSQATAVTSGAVAALLSWGYSPPQIVPILQASARATGGSALQVGAGVLRLPAR